MQFDLQNPHVIYVLIAYGLAALCFLGLALHTYLKWRAVHKMEKST